MTPCDIEDIKKILITAIIIDKNIKKLLKRFLRKALSAINSL